MELFLQFGYGMKALTLDLAKKWDGASVILSPRDMTPKQLETWSREFSKARVTCYLDPQCYCPREKLNRLIQYSYWDNRLNTHLQAQASIIDQRLCEIKSYNDVANTRAYILPSILNEYNDSWKDRFFLQSRQLIESAHKVMNDKPIFATIAFPKDFLIQNEDIIESILQYILSWDVDGYYVIAEAMDHKYLIDNPVWLFNVLHICAALKLAGKKVIYGYGNHQMLPLALLKVDALASGTWMNVRSFTNRFITVDEQRRKSTWVYYPEALSEYKLVFLDWAFTNNQLMSMKSKDKAFWDEGITKLFQGNVTPSSTGFNETDAFKHYLCCLRHQVEILNKPSYQETYSSYEMILNTAEREIERLEKAGVYGQVRSFGNFIDVNRAVINRLNKDYGFSLNMAWDTL